MAKESKCGCFTVLAFVCSHVGLSVIAVLYIVFGGLIFQHIESDIEREQSLVFKDVSESSDILIKEIWNMTRSNLIFDDKLYRELLRKKMFDHKNRYLSALLKGYSPYENLGEYWTLSGSILYALTLVTTIGIQLTKLWANHSLGFVLMNAFVSKMFRLWSFHVSNDHWQANNHFVLDHRNTNTGRVLDQNRQFRSEPGAVRVRQAVLWLLEV